jgi:hypothetical protein
VFYKYRSTKQLQFTLDILMRHRLFAARYSEMNDPMEGLWHYGGEGTLWPDEIRYVEDQIDKYRVTSVSLNPVSTLMWSHYADSHRGFAIGIEIPEQDGASLVPVQYSSHYTISKDATDVGFDVLSKKFKVWEYEHEVRVLGSKDFIKVVPREILFGIRADRNLADLITEIARTYCPKAETRHLQLSDLDTYVEPIPFDASDA